MLQKAMVWFKEWTMPLMLTVLALALAILVGAVLVALLRKVTLRILEKWGRFSAPQWEEWFREESVYFWFRQLIPTGTLYLAAPVIFANQAKVLYVFRVATLLYAVIVFLFLFEGLLDVTFRVYQEHPLSEKVSLRGVLQSIKVVLYCVAAILIFSVLFNKSPFLVLSGLGAVTAVLLLVFKDTLLGLVAGIKMATERMLVEGDVIDMPRHSASGIVKTIGLSTIQVENWDRSTTYLPTHLLLAESFINWRSMPESGGRRIKRSIPVDMNSVRICDETLLEKLEDVSLLKEYIAEKKKELVEWNREQEEGKTHPANSPRLTNLGLFRGYIKAWLQKHPKIHQEQTIMVRQLEPTSKGLPLEMYMFCNDTDWGVYETTQSEILEHTLSVMPLFELRAFQMEVQ